MIAIVSDSTCDLSKELIERYDIHILPLHVILGEEERLDGVNISPDEIYEWSDADKQTPKTSAPSIEDAIDLFQELLKEHDEIISFCISESMSASGNVMRLAAEELEAEDKIHVINSQNLSTGIGLLVIAAAEMVKENKLSAEILEKIQELIPRVRSSFVVDSLEYLRRGGRLSGAKALIGSVLRLHPKIAVKDGAMAASGNYRGNIEKAFANYVRDMEQDLKAAERSRVFITYSSKNEPAVSEIKSYLENLGVFQEILITRAGSVISSHCGPGALGVLFIAGK
ncbi:MAG: DegV family protein [Lachnospiraceae bacterium]|nr:DegV family protein [Lachnospiraceae bacterium]